MPIILIKKEYILYTILLLIGIIFICLLNNFILKLIVGIIPLLLLILFYFLKKPSSFIIIYFLLIPLCHPFFYEGILNFGEILAIPTVLFSMLFIYMDQSKKYSEIIYKNRHVLIALALIPFFGLLSTLANIGKIDLLENLERIVFKPLFVTIMTLVLFVYMSKFRKTKIIHILFIVILFSSAIVGLISLYSLMTGSPEWAIDVSALRVRGTFTEYNHLSGYVLLMFFFTLGFYFQSKRELIKSILLLLLFLDFVALLASQTLGGILGFVVGIFIIILFREHKVKNFTIAIVILTTLIIGAYFLYPPIFGKFSIFYDRLLDRLTVNYVGIKLIKRNFLFGTGTSTLKVILSHPNIRQTPFGPSWSLPHNLLISTFTKGGVFYFGAFAYLLYAGFKKLRSALPAINNSRNKVFYQTLLAGIIAFIVQNMTNNIIWHARIGIYIFLFFIIIVNLQEEGDIIFPSWL
jgi:hypothetical protein